MKFSSGSNARRHGFLKKKMTSAEILVEIRKVMVGNGNVSVSKNHTQHAKALYAARVQDCHYILKANNGDEVKIT